MELERKEDKNIWIESLRIISALGVVVMHVSAGYLRKVSNVGTYTFAEANIWHSFMRFAVGCFVMISGFLFLNPNRDETLRKILKKHVAKLMLIYVFWRIVYKVIKTGSSHMGHTLDCIYHLWFLPMLAGLYLLTPVLRKIAEDKKLVEYLIFLCLLLCYIPNLFRIIPRIYCKYTEVRVWLMATDYTAGYLCYYLTGFYFCHYGVAKRLKKIIYSLGVFSAVYGIAISEIYARHILKYSGVPTQNESMNTFLFAAAVFLFFEDYVGKKKWKKRTRDRIKRLSSHTLGIYLIHTLFVQIFKTNSIYDKLGQYACFMIPLFALVIFMLSFGAVTILKRIPVIRKLC